MKKILGINEAGENYAIGPLIICGIIIDKENIPQLNKINVLNSKLFTFKRRSRLKKKLDIIISDKISISVNANNIDKNNIPRIDIISDMILGKMPDLVYINIIESLSINKIKRKLKEKMEGKWNGKIIIKKKSGKNYKMIDAAYIIAKEYHENEIERIKGCWGNFGSGHCDDIKTINFLEEWYENNGNFPSYVRKSCNIIKNMKKNNELTMFDLLEE